MHLSVTYSREILRLQYDRIEPEDVRVVCIPEPALTWIRNELRAPGELGSLN